MSPIDTIDYARHLIWQRLCKRARSRHWYSESHRVSIFAHLDVMQISFSCWFEFIIDNNSLVGLSYSDSPGPVVPWIYSKSIERCLWLWRSRSWFATFALVSTAARSILLLGSVWRNCISHLTKLILSIWIIVGATTFIATSGCDKERHGTGKLLII